jgi:heterodisulfide reductase subunit A
MTNERDADKIGAVLVVGAGIGGMQAALLTAEAGFKTYLLDKAPAIGGLMPLLDRTFPTDTCGLCTSCPTQPAYCPFIECDRHPNIELVPYAEIEGVEGKPGHYRVPITRKARYVDAELCTGCGDCVAVCPVEVPRELGGGLETRRAIYRPYPQAFPDTYLIDREHCTECMECVRICPTQAVDLNMEPQRDRLEVGAIILTLGANAFDARQKGEYGFGRYENVLTSIQFERMLSLTSPSGGIPVRPSDGRVPKRIAFIQCVGSRDTLVERGYCSSMCCMYAIKQATLARERAPESEVTVFYMDIRAFGKDFDRYFERSRAEQGVIYQPSMISSVKLVPKTRNLTLAYSDEAPALSRSPERSEGSVEGGQQREEEFDLVVLSVGFGPPEGAGELASRLGIGLNEYGFCQRGELTPTETSRVGIFVGGAFGEPKDIPETVAETASAAASAARFLAASRGTLLQPREFVVAGEFPPERDVSYEDPKVGVFVCQCGAEIAEVVDVADVVAYAGGLRDVTLARQIPMACTLEGLEDIRRAITDERLNRVVVAGCSHRLYEGPLHDCLRSAGLNPYLLERVNLRGECAWVHRHDPSAATAKARTLVRMAAARARLLEPARRAEGALVPSGLVIGGGLAGLMASLSLAEQGFQVYLVEKEDQLGGNLRHTRYLMGDSDPQQYLADLIAQVESNEGITVYRQAKVEDVSGLVGQYKTVLSVAGQDEPVTLGHGAIIVATGAEESRPEEYLYGEHCRVITQRELEKKLADGDKAVLSARRIAMIQCVGSRDENRPYCSRVCCPQAVKNALRIKEANPQADVFVFYRDIRTYGFMEDDYRRAREAGVVFVRYDPEDKPQVSPRCASPPKLGGTEGGAKGEQVRVVAYDPALGGELSIDADWLVLSAGMVPSTGNEALARLLDVPLNQDGFFLEANPKGSPLEFEADGIYLCGLAHAPKLAAESIAQANGAAIRAAVRLGKERVEGPAIVATVDEELCAGCGLCVSLCPYGARQMDEVARIARVVEVLCRGCGLCVTVCPNGASQQRAFVARQIMAMLEAAL